MLGDVGLAGANWAAIVTAFGTVLIGSGIIFAGIQVLEAKKTRYADIAIRFAERWQEAPLVESREALTVFHTAIGLRNEIERAQRDEQRKFHLLLRIPNFFEEVAAAERFGWIPVEWVYSTWGSGIPALWDTWRPTIDFLRQPSDNRLTNEGVYQEFERLNDLVLELLAEEYFGLTPSTPVPPVPLWPWSGGGWLRF
jgi:hypothetical protein